MISLLFSGQGAQKPGMGLSLYENCPAARAVFERCPEPVLEYCFHGTEDELSRTDITQPCVYAVSMAAFAAFKREMESAGLTYAMMAGFSLGEYSALTAAGVFNLSDGYSLVERRAQWMHACGEGRMAALLGKEAEVADCLTKASEYSVWPVNFNCPGQTVVAGKPLDVGRFCDFAAGFGLRVAPLKVSGAFHSPLMAPAGDRIREALQTLTLHEEEVPVYSNVTGEPMEYGQMADLIARQAVSPVLWEKTIRNQIAAGVDTFVEIGVGNTLCGFVRRTDRHVRTISVQDPETLAAAMQQLTMKKDETNA